MKTQLRFELKIHRLSNKFIQVNSIGGDKDSICLHPSGNDLCLHGFSEGDDNIGGLYKQCLKLLINLILI
ncbi:hypothetical protein D3C80_1343710 [compost metagenome]